MSEERANVLRAMQVCRFCLSSDETLTSIYDQRKNKKQNVPLPLQLMACVAIEVFRNDGMPQLICNRCRNLTLQAYSFKSNCKKADDALKLFLATGSLSKPFSKTDFEHYLPQNGNQTRQAVRKPNKREEPSEKKIKIEQERPSSADSQDQNVNSGQNVEESILGLEDHDSDYVENEAKGIKVSQVKTDCFACPYCERSFPLKQLLDIHKQNHNRERNFSCDECGRLFFTKYDLGKHLQTHTGDKPYSCVACNKQFARESLLHRHERTHNDVPKYLCSQCDRTFLNKEDLSTHLEKHKKKRPFTCGICSKSFVFKQGLERHEQIHNEEKPHKCNYCEASFTSPIKLTRHITSHAGLRPYPCKLCGRTFLLSHHLTRHMRSHYAAKSNSAQGIGQHKCDICSMSFRRKDSLINHSAIHSMVNLKCVICFTEFSNANSVKEHITTHLSGLPHPCERCDYSFETQEQLEEHEVKHAEMEYEELIEKEVVEEARQHAAEIGEDPEEDQDVEEEEEEDEEDEGDVAEFTLTNDMNNPELVRRSKRSHKIKNFADFLKDELSSEDEEDLNDEEPDPEYIPQELIEEDAIKPIVRMEGTKVYKRKTPSKSIAKIVTKIGPGQMKQAPLGQINTPQVTTIENLGLTKQELRDLPTEKFVNMKIGDKTVRVQKLVLTKEEMHAMAKEGRIKGNTVLIKNAGQLPTLTPAPKLGSQKNTFKTLNDSIQAPSRPTIQKTYQRKVTENTEEGNPFVVDDRIVVNDVVIETISVHNDESSVD